MPTPRNSSPDQGPAETTTVCGAHRPPVSHHLRSVRRDLDRDAPFGHRDRCAGPRRVGRQRAHRGVGQHRAAFGMEQPTLSCSHRDLGEARLHTARVECVEGDVGRTHRGGQRVELGVGSQVDLSGLDEELHAQRCLQATPSHEGLARQAHVPLVVIGDADESATRRSKR